MNYLLLGPEEYLKQQYLEKLKKSILNDNKNLTLDFEVLYGGRRDMREISDSFNTLPFISKKRLIVIKDVNRLSAKEKNSILKYLKSPNDSTVLILESPSFEFSKFLQEVSKSTTTVKCNRLRDKDLDLWIKKEFALHRKKISTYLAGLIRELVGSDLFLLKNEIEKIVTFLGNTNEVTERHIEMLLGKPLFKRASKLTDLVLEKRIDEILASIDSFLTKEKPHQVLNLIAWQFRNFIKIKNLPKGLSREALSQKLDINERFVNKAIEQSKRFTEEDLEKNLEIILEADFFIKRGKLDVHHALERALVGLCR